MNNDVQLVIDFIKFSEGLKRELRHTWLSNDRNESVAEHTWRMALMAMIVLPKTALTIDAAKVLKMILIHDIVEISARDIPAVVHVGDAMVTSQKGTNEEIAIAQIRNLLGTDLGNEIYTLWKEFEEKRTNEAKFAKVMDKLEAMLQTCQQPKTRLVEREYDINFINEYSKGIIDLCMNDQFLIELSTQIKNERIQLVVI